MCSALRRRGGSSPLTRGKRDRRNRVADSTRLIPAHAGKTRPSTSPRPRFRAHPRSRGENFLSRRLSDFDRGSSPLTRGKLEAGALSVTAGRLIPAHAGKTTAAPRSRGRRRAHPRSRGENAERRRGGELLGGSSPLTRGKHPRRNRRTNRRRLIPAHAGKTSQRPTARCPHRAHPRSRGENCQPRGVSSRAMGSSPLTRGKRVDELAGRPRSGLIPAHAGKTARSPRQRRRCRAHPRSRGENAFGGGDLCGELGSSPLTRGKLPGLAGGSPMNGLIPAHAGKTAAP